VPGEIDTLAKTFAPAASARNLAQPPGEVWRIALISISLADGLLARARASTPAPNRSAKPVYLRRGRRRAQPVLG
jgi:hypothetical protein